MTQNILLLCSRWFKFANYKELYHDVEEYFQMKYAYNVSAGNTCFYKSFSNAECFTYNPEMQRRGFSPVIFRSKMPETSQYIEEARRTMKCS